MVYDVFHNLDKLLLWSHLPPLQYISILSPKPGPTCGFANATPLPYGPSHISSHSCQNAPVFLLSPLPTGSYLAILRPFLCTSAVLPADSYYIVCPPVLSFLSILDFPISRPQKENHAWFILHLPQCLAQCLTNARLLTRKKGMTIGGQAETRQISTDCQAGAFPITLGPFN